MKNLKTLLLISVVITLEACAALGVSTPKTFNEKLASGYITVTTVRQTTATLLIAQTITKSDAQSLQTQADAARTGLDAAKELQVTANPGANDKLEVTLQILKSLQIYLETRSTK